MKKTRRTTNRTLRNKFYVVGNMLITNMTAAEVKKLDKIMNPPERGNKPIITLREYIDRFNPSVRRWISKAGNAMCEIEVLHDKIGGHLCYEETIVQQEAHLDSVTVYLKEADE